MGDSSMAGRHSDSAGRRGGGFSHPVAVVVASALAAGGVLSTVLNGAGGTDRAAVRGVVTLADGAVTYAGRPPEGEAIDMSADAYCVDQHTSEVIDQPIRMGSNGGLADVLVHVTNAPSGGPDASDEVLLDQIGCLYTPFVIVARAGQTVTIRNSDQTLHNVRVSPRVNRGFNLGQPIRGMESRRSFSEEELGIPVQCDIHGWMHASIHVLDHGFFALSAEDGSFALPDLPAGEYTIEAVHPTLGTSSQTVTVGEAGAAEIAFEFGG
jgi:hypothetical protein